MIKPGSVMNGYERIMTVFNKGIPDCVPIWELLISRNVIKSLTGHENLVDFVDQFDYDGITVGEQQKFNWVDDKMFVDEWGIKWQLGEKGDKYPITGHIKSTSDLEKYTPPDPNTGNKFEPLRKAVDRFKNKKAIFFLAHDAFEFSWYLRGIDNLFVDYIDNPEFVHKVARIVLDYKKKIVEKAIAEGADIIVSGDDYAYDTNPMMSITHFREFVLPYLKELIALVKQKGKLFVKHCDGRIWTLLDDFVAAGIDGLHPLEPVAGMDIGTVKEKYGKKIVLFGNVDCSKVLPFGTTADVVDAVKEIIAKASPGGGHVIASSNSIHSSVNPENLRAMIETTRKFGKYPLDESMVNEYRNKNYIQKFM